METIVHGYLSSSYCWFAAVAADLVATSITMVAAVVAATVVAANCP